MTDRDLALARVISELAAAEGVAARPDVAKLVEIALDTPDAAAVRPFWRAVLDMREHGADGPDPDLRDDAMPSMWFQQSGSEGAPAAVPSRPVGGARGRRAADRGRGRCGRCRRQRRGGAGVLGAGRRRREQGLPLHLAGP